MPGIDPARRRAAGVEGPGRPAPSADRPPAARLPAADRTTGDGRATERERGRTARPRRFRDTLSQWPLIAALVLLWCAVWEDFSLHVALAGLGFTLLVMVLFPMPRIPFSGRLNPWWFLVFTVKFLADVVRSSVEVSKVVLLRGRGARSSIVGVRLRSHDDLVMTLVSHALALVPGSIVLDVDRARATLYLHVLDATTDEDIEDFRTKALRVEAGIIKAVGSRENLELVHRFPDSAPPEEDSAERRRPAFPRQGGTDPIGDTTDHAKEGA